MKSRERLQRGSGWENKYLVEKMRQNLRTAFELLTRSVPFRCAALLTKPGQTG